MGYLVVPINGEDLVLKIKNINGVGFYDRLTRSRVDSNLFLSLIVEEPLLTAEEWYTRIPEVYKEKMIQAIINYVNEHYHYQL